MVLRRVARHSDPQTTPPPASAGPGRDDGDWARLDRHYDLMVSSSSPRARQSGSTSTVER
jgi:hypothetical protein